MKNSNNDDNIDKLVVGSAYSIHNMLHFLDRDHNVKIGHCVIMNEHLYHLGYESLKRVKEAIEQSDSLLKKGLPNVMILAMIDPREELLNKYYNFSESIEEDVYYTLKRYNYNKGALVLSADILKKVREFDRNVIIKNIDELVQGMDVYFSKRGINVKTYYGDEYLIFRYSDART